MSYQRDKDAYTRGPGASASHDRSPAHRAQRARAVRLSAMRDAQLAEFTFGPNGGMGAIREIDDGGGSPGSGGASTSVFGKGVVFKNKRTGQVVTAGPSRSGTGQVVVKPANGTTIMIDPIRKPVIVGPPAPLPLPGKPYPPSSDGRSVGGGGGGGTVSGGGVMPPPFVPYPDDGGTLDPGPDASSSSSFASTKWLVIGGVALVAWFVLRDQ